MALVAPHAVNWQVKQSPFGEDSDIPTDLVRLLKIIRRSGYSGYLPIETLGPKGKEYDPFTVVPAFLTRLRKAILGNGLTLSRLSIRAGNGGASRLTENRRSQLFGNSSEPVGNLSPWAHPVILVASFSKLE
jgi:hypothetical protein